MPTITGREARGGTIFVTGIERGHVFWVDVCRSDTRGSEQFSVTPRPWVVISSDPIHGANGLPIVVAVPLTHSLAKDEGTFRLHRIRILDTDFRRFTPEQGQPLPPGDSLALTEQVRALAHERLKGDPIAKVTKQALFALEAALKFVMAFA